MGVSCQTLKTLSHKAIPSLKTRITFKKALILHLEDEHIVDHDNGMCIYFLWLEQFHISQKKFLHSSVFSFDVSCVFQT